MPKRKITATDWLRGAAQSMRDGTAMNPFATQARINEAHDGRITRDKIRLAKQQRDYPAPSRPDGYYSKNRKDGSVDVFIGRDGQITSERPHIHLIHSAPEKRIVFRVTHADGSHGNVYYLPADASGNEVNAVVDRLRPELRG